MSLKRLLVAIATIAAVTLPAATFAKVTTRLPAADPTPTTDAADAPDVATPSTVEVIHDFTVTATLTSERALRITEAITYDFGDQDRHGIYRYIPVTYLRGGANYDLRPKVISVTMDNGTIPFDVTNDSGQLYLKIGDPDNTITGPHVYAITYETDRAINFFPDHSELYWNVTGNEWPVSIEHSSFTLSLPAGMTTTTEASIQTACFTGLYGSTEASCMPEVKDGKVMFTATRTLLEQEGMTVVIGMPLGLIRAPTWQEKFWMFVQDNMAFFVPILAFFVMLYLWRIKGRDPKLGTVIPLYEPPMKLPPAELVCAKEDCNVPMRATTAIIIDMARRGFLHIKYTGKKDYTFVQTDKGKEMQSSPDMPGVTKAERIIVAGLFENGPEVSIDDLQANKFYEHASAARAQVGKSVMALGAFDKNPGLVRATYVGIGFAVMFLLFFFLAATPFGVGAAIMTGIIIFVFGWFMPRRTESGVKLLADIKGFEWFLTVTEKDRLTFHNAPSKTPEQFMEFLPYAIALGVEKDWAKQFESMQIPPPDWAEGQGWSNLNTIAFVSSLDTLHSEASSGYSAPSSSGSGGSGFSGGGSGGGGGGGGGGSW